ncbi:MAG: hypothetical protein PHE21_01355 [Candidatus Dojkabacteria bacterium]|nr:hypothetical protein [Candidatus Dojkabacteria bacterium]
MNKKEEVKNKKPEDALIINKSKKKVVEVTKKKLSDNIDEAKSINLIPKLSKEEVVQERKKKTLNLGSIISLMVLVLISIVTVGFNIVSKMQLNNEKEKLYDIEEQVNTQSTKILANNEIKERVLLYKEIASSAYSPKEVIEYINTIAERSGSTNITSFTFTNELAFIIDGKAYNLEDVSKFWFLLTNDAKVEDVILESVSKGSEGAAFKFKGNLVFKDFIPEE